MLNPADYFTDFLLSTASLSKYVSCSLHFLGPDFFEVLFRPSRCAVDKFASVLGDRIQLKPIFYAIHYIKQQKEENPTEMLHLIQGCGLAAKKRSQFQWKLALKIFLVS